MHQLRLMENISMTAAQRYEVFAKRYPKIIARVPQTQIAAYLGITPVFLSKIKKELLKNQPEHLTNFLNWFKAFY